MDKNLTALMSAYARYYHTYHYQNGIINDTLAGLLLTDEETENIKESLIKGKDFFLKEKLNDEDSLRKIMNEIISPSVLARSYLAKKYLLKLRNKGVKNYLVIASGLDTSIYEGVLDNAYEIDLESSIADKIRRLKLAHIPLNENHLIGYDLRNHTFKSTIEDIIDLKKKTFVTMLGLSYYLKNEDFTKLIQEIVDTFTDEIFILFDYPVDYANTKKIKDLASASSNEMVSKYSLDSIITELKYVEVVKNYTNNEIDEKVFAKFNDQNHTNMSAPKDVNYLIIKRKNHD